MYSTPSDDSITRGQTNWSIAVNTLTYTHVESRASSAPDDERRDVIDRAGKRIDYALMMNTTTTMIIR